MDKADNTLIELQCYEPAGSCIQLSERDALGHTLIIGGSGAGKTTRVITPLVKQLVEYNGSNQQDKIGLCVLDTKGDGVAIRTLQTICREAGRENDLAIITPATSYGIDLLEPIRRHGLEGVDVVAGTLSQMIPECEGNRFWEMTMESLIRQVLRLLIFSGDPPEFSKFVSLITEYLLRFRFSQWTVNIIDELNQSDDEDYDTSNNHAVNETIATHRMWTTLDCRTRSNLQSMAAPIVDALASPLAESLLGQKAPFDICDVVTNGCILSVSIDAVRHPELASLIAALVKSRFYEAILSREVESNPDLRLAGLVLDDWPLCATGGIEKRHSDVSALSILRSRKGFLITSTQSVAALDVKMGARSRAAAIANFANIFFMRGRDLDADSLAAAYLGETKRKLIDRSIHEPVRGNRKPSTARFEREQIMPAVPLGALARLPVGEAYAVIGEIIYNRPHALIPIFDSPSPEQENGQEH